MTTQKKLMTNWRWWMVVLLFIATTVNYMDRQVLSLTWKDFIAPEFHWNDNDYGTITAIFSIVYAICMLFAGKFVDWMGTKKGYLWAIGVWSAGACLHAACGWATMHIEGYASVKEMAAVEAGSAAALAIASISVWLFIAARCILALGEAGNFPAAIKTTAEYFPKKDRAFATSIFNAGASVGALVAPATIPLLAQFFKDKGIGGGWEMAFNIIGSLSMLMIDKRQDVRTLRSLGATDGQVCDIFMLEGRMISLAGAAVGLLLGLALCWLQQEFGLISMGSSAGSFIVEAYPVSVHVGDLVIVFLTVLVVGWAAVWWPVRYLSRRLL